MFNSARGQTVVYNIGTPCNNQKFIQKSYRLWIFKISTTTKIREPKVDFKIYKKSKG
jgi:hypothetical protein